MSIKLKNILSEVKWGNNEIELGGVVIQRLSNSLKHRHR